MAHVLADRLDPPSADLDDEGLREWAGDQLSRLPDIFEEMGLDEDELRLIAQFLLSRGVR